MKSVQELPSWERLARHSLLPLLVAAGVALLPRPVTAQEERIDTPYRWIEGGTRIGVYGGYAFTSRGDLDLGPGSSSTFGTRLRARLSSPLSIEIGFGLGSSDLWVVDPRLEGGPAPVDTVTSNWLIIEASIQLALTGARSYRRLQPYVILGGGVLMNLSTEKSDVLASPQDPFEYSPGTAAIIHLGLGVEYDISRRLGLGFEARDNLWRLKTPDGWFDVDVLQNLVDTGAVVPKESQWVHNFELTAGLYYYF